MLSCHDVHVLLMCEFPSYTNLLYRSIESLATVLRTLHNTTHNGFPIWAHEADVESAYGEAVAGEDGSKRLEGIILRSQLLVLLQRRHFVDHLGNPVSVLVPAGYSSS